jgi:hypothetical protein
VIEGVGPTRRQARWAGRSVMEARSMLRQAQGVALFLVVTSIGCRPGAPNAEPVGADPSPVADPMGPPAVVAAAAAGPEATDPFEWMEPALAREITDWRKGTVPPAFLLRFSHRPPPEPMMCGMRALGDLVDDYISRIIDADLLEALLLDSRADAVCVQAAGRRLLDTHGTKTVRTVLASRRGEWAHRPEVATMAQLLTAPYARVKVAAIEKSEVDREQAQAVLTGLKADLERGDSWARAYRRASELLPNVRRGGTLVGYRFDGLIAETGFDLLYRRLAIELDLAHVRALFAAKGGTHVWETADAYWLYHAEAFDK